MAIRFVSCNLAPEPLVQAPRQRYALGIFPTPLHRWHPPGVPEGVEMYIKRDDLSGMQLSGNKVSLKLATIAANSGCTHASLVVSPLSSWCNRERAH